MSDETFNSLNDLQEYYLSSFHKVFKVCIVIISGDHQCTNVK